MLLAARNVVVAAPSVSTLDLATVDRFINTQMENHRIPGLALAITHDDQVVYVRGYGTARDGEPVTEKTQFRLASLSKSFTALAVLQLVEAGQINLDAPVSQYLPDFALAAPTTGVAITVRHLLNQTSGLADTGFVDGLTRPQSTLTDRIAGLRGARPVDPPGVAFHYFDPNYQVLARLVEVVSGQPFDAYLQAHIFMPLSMRDSVSALTSDVSTQHANHLAQGHIVVYGVTLAVLSCPAFLAVAVALFQQRQTWPITLLLKVAADGTPTAAYFQARIWHSCGRHQWALRAATVWGGSSPMFTAHGQSSTMAYFRRSTLRQCCCRKAGTGSSCSITSTRLHHQCWPSPS